MSDGYEKIDEGDLVDHKVFGLGKVQAVDGPVCGPGETGTGSGYRIAVAWDDPERQDSSVMSWALKKISSPDTRPFSYWDKKWKPLRAEWLRYRREVEQLCTTFDPAPDEQMLAEAMKAETAAWEKMKAFLANPYV